MWQAADLLRPTALMPQMSIVRPSKENVPWIHSCSGAAGYLRLFLGTLPAMLLPQQYLSSCRAFHGNAASRHPTGPRRGQAIPGITPLQRVLDALITRFLNKAEHNNSLRMFQT
jgi:hypothetical protein